MDEIFVQDDPKWADQVWYDPGLVRELRKLAKAIDAHGGKKRSKVTAVAVSRAAKRFQAEVDRFVNGKTSIGGDEGQFKNSGCWHTSVANMLASFRVKLRGKRPTPTNVLKELQAHAIHTLTGYCENVPFDAISVITHGQVQLRSHRDFGVRGRLISDGELERFFQEAANINGRAILNVNSHERLGAGDSHYVLMTRYRGGRCSIEDPDLDHRDQGWLDQNYRRVYQICTYVKT